MARILVELRSVEQRVLTGYVSFPDASREHILANEGLFRMAVMEKIIKDEIDDRHETTSSADPTVRILECVEQFDEVRGLPELQHAHEQKFRDMSDEELMHASKHALHQKNFIDGILLEREYERVRALSDEELEAAKSDPDFDNGVVMNVVAERKLAKRRAGEAALRPEKMADTAESSTLT